MNMEVDFCIINDLSIPLCDYNYRDQLFDFIKVVRKLKTKNINTIRANFDFRDLEFFTKTKNLNQILGQESNDFSIRLKSLVANSITKFESPLIKDNEKNQKEELEINSEYFINSSSCNTGLACADILDTFCVSFLTSETWKSEEIELLRTHIIDDDSVIIIKNISTEEHVDKLIFNPTHTFSNEKELISSLISEESKFLLQFSSRAISDIRSIFEEKPTFISKIYELLSSIQNTPDSGIGKPERLKEDKSGDMSRRVTQEDRIVYKQLDSEKIEIKSCKGHYE